MTSYASKDWDTRNLSLPFLTQKEIHSVTSKPFIIAFYGEESEEVMQEMTSGKQWYKESFITIPNIKRDTWRKCIPFIIGFLCGGKAR